MGSPMTLETKNQSPTSPLNNLFRLNGVAGTGTFENLDNGGNSTAFDNGGNPNEMGAKLQTITLSNSNSNQNSKDFIEYSTLPAPN
jgi:hypothetical protein